MSILHVTRSRPNDYYYDPSNISAGAKDYYRQANYSKLAMMKFAVCPIFPSMFSDLQNYPCKQYVIRRMAPIPPYQDKVGVTTSGTRMSRATVVGSDRYKYFHNSPVANGQGSKVVIPTLEMSCFYNVDNKHKQEEMHRELRNDKKRDVKVQTVYRENSVQTSPWQPDYKVMQGTPELLKLDFLKWGEGLPAGMAEVEYIDRMRFKRMWEMSLPAGTSPETLKIKKDMIMELSRVEWLNRERDIEEIQTLRLELLEKMLNELHVRSKCRTEQKIRAIVDVKMAQRQEQIEKVRKEAEREKRRLKLQFAGVLTKYTKADVYEEHANYNSELYCPLMRHGTNPKYKHEKLCKFKKRQGISCTADEYNELPSNLAMASEIGEIKLEGTRLCIRETKWTLPVLKALYEELKEMRIEKKQYPNLRVCIGGDTTTIMTPEILESSGTNVERNKAATYIQKILRGRAAQNKIFMGRERCHELIDELRGNYALLKGDVCKKARIREKRKEEQLNAARCMSNMKALEGSLRKLSGSVAGTLFDFLNKDLQRLLRERRAHAMILLVERLRQIREAEESGRRQKETQRRKEHDEMFKQVVKVHQDTVDLYLQDIVTEGMQFSSEEKAKEYVQNMTEKLNEEQQELMKSVKQIDREEYIASMVYNFVIPEVEKSIVRDRMKKSQQLYLRNAHDEIYKQIDELPKPKLPFESSESDSTESVMRLVKDKHAMKIAKATERQVVIDDIRAILDDLVAVPYAQSALKDLIPCGIARVDDESSTHSEAELGPEEDDVHGEGEGESEDDEKFEGVDAVYTADTEAIPFEDEELMDTLEGEAEE